MAAAVGVTGPESDRVALAVAGGKGFSSGAYSSALSVAPLGAAISWKPYQKWESGAVGVNYHLCLYFLWDFVLAQTLVKV